MDYSFHHIQNFTKDVSEFRGKIDGSKVAGGQDLPESGMDAIMQTIVCQGLLLKVFSLQIFKWLSVRSVIECYLFYFSDHIWVSEKGKSKQARKIIVYFTDARVHSARDGSIGGILTPSGTFCIILQQLITK